MPRSALIPLMLAALAVPALAACSQDPVKAAPAAKADTQACADVSAAWPSKVAGHSGLAVTTNSPSVRAWGDDAATAVIARCGVTSPGPTVDSCFSADDVDWVQTAFDGGMRYVTYGREPAVEVLVPTEAKLDGTTLAAFARAAKKIPQGEHRCS